MTEYANQSQAVVQYHGFRRILSLERSAWLINLLQAPAADFRRRFALGISRAAFDRDCPGQGRIYLNLGHTGLDQEGLKEWAERSDVRPVYFVHDLIPIAHPQYCRAGELARHRRRMLTLLDTAAAVIGNSQATVDDLAAFAEAEGRPMPRSIVGWLGADKPSRTAGDDPAEPSFVALGTIEARKNHMLLLDIWAKLAARKQGKVPKLLLIGQRGWECDAVFDRLATDPMLRGSVIELNHCSDEEAFGHLSRARALLFPTLAEGFGLPLVESLAIGTPAIASDLPVFREIGQGVPDLIDPADADAWLAAVEDYSDPDNARRRAQLQRLKNFHLFTWRDHFASISPWLTKL